MELFNHISLTTIDVKLPCVRPRDSLFADIEVNGKTFYIMVDTRATQNFVTEEKDKEFGLIIMSSDTMLKILNCLSTNINGLAPRMSLSLGGWKGVTNFLVVLMDVFDILLGLDFWYVINAYILPRLNQLSICDSAGSYIVPLICVA